MSLSVKENREGQVLVLSPQGRIDSVNAREFQALVTGYVDGGEENMIVDLSNLDYISSAGIRVMQLASKALKEAGGQFLLCAMRDHIGKVFRISGFDRVIAISDTLEDALARFSKS